MPSFYHQLRQISDADSNKGAVVVSVIRGAAIGSKALWSDGRFAYTEGDPEVLAKFAPLLKDLNQTQVVTIDNASAFCEPLSNENHLVICGAGHISMPIIQMGNMLGFHTTVIDDRLIFANNARSAQADQVICEPFATALDGVMGSANHYFVIVTRGHRYDQDCLGKIIAKKNAYIGMIGSKARVKIVMKLLEEQSVDQALLASVYSPIGLKIGAQTPEEIAVSIMAEVIQVKSAKKNGCAYPEDIVHAILSEELQDAPKALVTITARKGSAPRGVGTKMLVMSDGTLVGTIGGGCVESDIIGVARQCAQDGKPCLRTVDLSAGAEDDGMVCGGIIDVYVEPVTTQSV